MNPNERKGPSIEVHTELRQPVSPVDLAQEKELRKLIGEEEEVRPTDIIETMAPGADKGRRGEDADKDQMAA